VIAEDGSDLAAELWAARAPAVSSVLAYPEGRAALAAARRAGRLTASQHRSAVAAFGELQDELGMVGVDATLARHAGELAERLSLRGFDAVHLATALAVAEPTTLVTWDRDLSRAAAGSGCSVAPASL
jgi:uncharacterized protein